MNIPNILTIIRILFIPVFVVIYYLGFYGWNIVTAILIAIASVTDYLDGAIARKYNLITDFGKLIDPIADKLLVAAALLILLDWGKVSAWVVIILIGREFIISGFRMVAAGKGVVIAAGMSGKIKTVVQMLGVILLFLNNWFFAAWNVPLGEIFIYASVVLSVWSCGEYIIKNRDLVGKGA